MAGPNYRGRGEPVFREDGGRAAVVQSGEPTRRRGSGGALPNYSASDLFMGRGPQVFGGGILGGALNAGTNLFSSAAEGGLEFMDWMETQAKSDDQTQRTEGGHSENMGHGNREGGDGNRNIDNILDKLVDVRPFGTDPNGDQAEGSEGTPHPWAVEMEETGTISGEPGAAETLQTVEELTKNQAIVDSMLDGEDLSPRAMYELGLVRESIAEQMKDAELQLQKHKSQLGVQDVLFNFQAEQLGFDLDLAPLEEAIQQEGSVGRQTMEAINAIANDASLSMADKNEAVDLVMQRQHFSGALIEAVDEMVFNRDKLQELEQMGDVELARLNDIAEFFNPTFAHTTIVDPLERAESIMLGVFDETELAEDIAAMDDIQFDVYLRAQQAVMQGGVEGAESNFAELEKITGKPASAWREAFAQAQERIINSNQAAEDAIDAKSLVPGGEGMVYALANAGRNLNIGLSDEALTLMANSAPIHAIIKTMSQGKSGFEGPGTIRGVGGLSQDIYRHYMGEEWTKDKGMEWEMQALILYIVDNFDADPYAALDFWRETGEWGGVNSFGGNE